MIQRIQTVYFLVAAALSGALFGLPFGSAAVAPAGVFADGKLDVFDYPALLGVVAAAIVLALGAVFLYRNYSLQKTFARLAMLSQGALGGLAAFWFYSAGDGGSLGLGLFVPILALIVLFLGLRGVQADERIIKSADRIR